VFKYAGASTWAFLNESDKTLMFDDIQHITGMKVQPITDLFGNRHLSSQAHHGHGSISYHYLSK